MTRNSAGRLTTVTSVGVVTQGIRCTWQPTSWSFVATGVILLAIKYTMGLRLHDRDEEIGLDASQHDEVAYSLTDD